MKRILTAVLVIVMLISMFGCAEEKTETMEIVKSDTSWFNEEMDISQELYKYENLSLESCYLDEKMDEIVFTTSRKMENQPNVGYSNETDNILIYRNFEDRSGIEVVNVDLYEGIVTDAFTVSGDLYYTVFYPYAGKGEVIYRDTLYLKNYVIYTFECESVSMGSSPLEMFKIEGELFAMHSYETENGCEKKLFYLRGICFTEMATFTDTESFSLNIVSVTSDEYLYKVESRDQVNIKYWKVKTGENERTFELFSDEELIYQHSMPYSTGDSYRISEEDILIYRTKQGKTTEYKVLDVLNTQLNQIEQIDVMQVYSIDVGEGYIVAVHGDYSRPDISVIRVDGPKVYINPVEVDTENCLVRTGTCREGAVVLLKNLDGGYKIYKLI